MQAIGGAHAHRPGARLEVLWAGAVLKAIDALEQLGLQVTVVDSERCAEQVALRAPDMVVFSATDAAHADAMMNELRMQSPELTIPMMTVWPGAAAIASPQRRATLVGGLSAELPSEALAGEIHSRLRELAMASSQWDVLLASHELDTWLDTTLRDASSGFLISADPPLVVALASNGQVAPNPEAFRAAFAAIAAHEPRRLRFIEVPRGRLRVVKAAQAKWAASDLSNACVAVIHDDAARQQAHCQALVEAGADAHAVGVEPGELLNVPSLAPTIIVVAASALAATTLAELWQDPRLSSVSWLVVDESNAPANTQVDIIGPVSQLLTLSRQRQHRLAEGELIVGRIESLGTAGWLKVVSGWAKPLTLHLRGVLGQSELTLAEGKIREALFFPAGAGEPQSGRAALQATLALPFGRVLIGSDEAVKAFEASMPVRPRISSPRAQPAMPEAEAGAHAAPESTSVPVQARSSSPAPAESAVPAAEGGDFQERPTQARAAVSKAPPRAGRSSAPEPRQHASKQPPKLARLVPLKAHGAASLSIPTPPPRTSAAPPSNRSSLAKKEVFGTPATVVALQAEERPVIESSPAARPTPSDASALEAIVFDTSHEELPPVTGAAAAEHAGARAPNGSQTEAVYLTGSLPLTVNEATYQVVLGIGDAAANDEVQERPPAAPPSPRKRWPVVLAVITLAALASIALLRLSPTSVFHWNTGSASASNAATAAPSAAVEAPRPADPPPEPPALAPSGSEDVEPSEDSEKVRSAAQPEREDTAAMPSSASPPAGDQDNVRKVRLSPVGALVERAKDAREASRNEKAEELLKEALALDPNDFSVRYQMALTLVRLRRFEEAHAELAAAIELNPTQPVSFLLQGDIYLQQGKRRDALSAWTRCLEARPNFQSCEERLARWATRLRTASATESDTTP